MMTAFANGTFVRCVMGWIHNTIRPSRFNLVSVMHLVHEKLAKQPHKCGDSFTVIPHEGDGETIALPSGEVKKMSPLPSI